MGEERAPWEPIAVLGAGGCPPKLDEGATREAVPLPPSLPPTATPVPTPAALTTDALELERQRLEIERERLALDRARLELDRERAFPSAPPPQPTVPTAPHPGPRRPRTSRHTGRPPGRPADRRPVDGTRALVRWSLSARPCPGRSSSWPPLPSGGGLPRTPNGFNRSRWRRSGRRSRAPCRARADAARGQAEGARAEREQTAQRETMTAKTLREAEARSRPAPPPGPAPKPKGDAHDDTWTPRSSICGAGDRPASAPGDRDRTPSRGLGSAAAPGRDRGAPARGKRARRRRPRAPPPGVQAIHMVPTWGRSAARAAWPTRAVWKRRSTRRACSKLLHVDHPTVPIEIAGWRAMRQVQEARKTAVAARRSACARASRLRVSRSRRPSWPSSARRLRFG